MKNIAFNVRRNVFENKIADPDSQAAEPRNICRNEVTK
jgi:hypothetical protein